MGGLGALNFNTPPPQLLTVFCFGPHLQQKVVWQCLLSAQRKRNKNNKECNSIKKQSINPPPPLSAALMRFHENSETEQVGVVAPGARTAKLSRMRMQHKTVFVICVSAAYKHVRQSRRDFILWAHVVLYKMVNSAVHPHPFTQIHSEKHDNVSVLG